MLEGVIVYKNINAGSKSEGLRPFLYLGEGKYLEVWRSGDYSLCGDALKEFDGMPVYANGEVDESTEIFVITEIEINLSAIFNCVLDSSVQESEIPASVDNNAVEEAIPVSNSEIADELNEEN